MTDYIRGEVIMGKTVAATIRFGNNHTRVTPEVCEQHGGHCYVFTGMARPSSPPQYQEQCKHCDKTRWAIPQEQYRYVE